MRHFFLVATVAVLMISAGTAHADPYNQVAPTIIAAGPSGVLPSTASQVTLYVITDENSACRYATAPMSFASMPNLFDSTSTTYHIATLAGLSSGRYDYYVRCAMPDGTLETAPDYPVSFRLDAGAVADTAAPVILSASPSGVYAAGTQGLYFTVSTDENALCRYATSSLSFADMKYTFASTGGTFHSSWIAGLKDGQSYEYHLRCRDKVQNEAADFPLNFTIQSSTVSSSPSVPTLADIAQRIKSAQAKFSVLLKNPTATGFRDGLLSLLQDLLAIQKDLKSISGQ